MLYGTCLNYFSLHFLDSYGEFKCKLYCHLFDEIHAFVFCGYVNICMDTFAFVDKFQVSVIHKDVQN